MSTKLMDRLFSAMENNETDIMNQLEDDINIALEDGQMEAEDQYSISKVGDNEVKIHDKVNDETTLAKVTDDNIELKSADEVKDECDTKEFAIGKFKNKKMIIEINDNDFVVDFDKRIVYNSDDKRQQFNFNPNSSIVSLVEKIEKEMGTKTFTNRHLAEHKQNTLLNNISDLSPELQKYVTDKYESRFNKMKNFCDNN